MVPRERLDGEAHSGLAFPMIRAWVSGRFAQSGAGLRRVEEGIEEHSPVARIEHEPFVFCD